MACHNAQCGCIDEDGNFPCASVYAKAWCPDDYLLLDDECHETKWQCTQCFGTWCNYNPELCTPTLSPVVPNDDPSNFPTSSPPTLMPTNGPSLVDSSDGPELTLSVSVWLIVGVAVGGGILIGVVCSLFFCCTGRSKRATDGKINDHTSNVGTEIVCRIPGVVKPEVGESDILISKGDETTSGYPRIRSSTTIELDPGSTETHFEEEGPLSTAEGVVLPQRTTTASIIRRTTLEGERSTGIPIKISNHYKQRSAYQINERGEKYQLNMFSPDRAKNTGEKSTSMPNEYLKRIEINSKIESPSMSGNDYPDLPSPNWDRNGISFDDHSSGSRQPGLDGEHTEAALLESANDIYAPPAKRVTLGGDQEVDGDEESVSEIKCSISAKYPNDIRLSSKKRVE